MKQKVKEGDWVKLKDGSSGLVMLPACVLVDIDNTDEARVVLPSEIVRVLKPKRRSLPMNR